VLRASHIALRAHYQGVVVLTEHKGLDEICMSCHRKYPAIVTETPTSLRQQTVLETRWLTCIFHISVVVKRGSAIQPFRLKPSSFRCQNPIPCINDDINSFSGGHRVGPWGRHKHGCHCGESHSQSVSIANR
jgi:hypothetical protein